MEDENDRKYVRTAEIPEWMASTLGKMVPLVLIALMGAAFLCGLTLLLLAIASRVSNASQSRADRDRCTGVDCRVIRDRVTELEKWRSGTFKTATGAYTTTASHENLPRE